MKTRQASLRELELKLKTTLQQLDLSNNLNNNLLQEREESEFEIQKIIEKNNNLRNQLMSKDTELTDLREQRDQFQVVSEYHSQCNSSLDNAFDRIKELQFQLRECKKTIVSMNDHISQMEQAQTIKHYNKLVKNNDKIPLVTIDLTSSYNQEYENENKLCTERKKIILKPRMKKRTYIKLKKRHQINKKVLPRRKLVKNIILGLEKDKTRLRKELNDYERVVDHYEREYSDNMEKIVVLETDLQKLNCKYTLTQCEIREYIAAIDELLAVSYSNLQMIETRASEQLYAGEDIIEMQVDIGVELLSPSPTLVSSLSSAVVEQETNRSKTCPINQSNYKNMKVFCDSIGQGLGAIIGTNAGGSFINNCMPNLSYACLIKKVTSEKHNKNDNIIILIGNSDVTRIELIKSIESLLQLQRSGTVNKIVVSTFPYSSSLTTQHNIKIHELNIILYNLIASNENELLFFDINNYIHNFVLMPNHQFLSKNQKNAVVKILVYILQVDCDKHNSCVNGGLITIKTLNL